MRSVVLASVAAMSLLASSSAFAAGEENDPKIVVHIPKNQYATIYAGRYRAEASQVTLWTNRNGRWEIIDGPMDPWWHGSGNSCAGNNMRLWQKMPPSPVAYDVKVSASVLIGSNTYPFERVDNLPHPHFTVVDYYTHPQEADRNTSIAVVYSPDEGPACP